MRIKNKRIYSTDQEWLVRMREEYTLYGGWDTKLEKGCLTVYAYKRKKKKRKDDEKKDRKWKS